MHLVEQFVRRSWVGMVACLFMFAACGGSNHPSDVAVDAADIAVSQDEISPDTAGVDAREDTVVVSDVTAGDVIGDIASEVSDVDVEVSDVDVEDVIDDIAADVSGADVSDVAACVPDCGVAVCGLDPVCGTLSCGICDDGNSCTADDCESMGGTCSYVLISGCGAFSITYDGNGATGGLPPGISYYTAGQTVTVATNSGSLIKTDYTFAGWNTDSAGGGSSYVAGTGTFTMPASNVVLYASWVALSPTVVTTYASVASSKRPDGIAWDGNYLYVGEVNDEMIYKIDPATGEAVSSISIESSHALALDNEGNIWTTSYWDDPPVLYRYPLTGGAYNKSVTLAGTMTFPTALAYDPTNSVFWMVNTNSPAETFFWKLSGVDGSEIDHWVMPSDTYAGLVYGLCMDKDPNYIWMTDRMTLSKVSISSEQIVEQHTFLGFDYLFMGCAQIGPRTFWLVDGRSDQILKVDIPLPDQ